MSQTITEQRLIRDSWIRTSVNNAALALERGASCEELVAAIQGRHSQAQPGEPEVRALALKWLRSSSQSVRDTGVEHPERVIFAHLWQQAHLSEGQCAKVLGIDRIGFRAVCDDLGLNQWEGRSPLEPQS